MNADDLSQLRALITRSRDLVDRLRQLAIFAWTTEDPTPIEHELAQLEVATGTLARAIQDREERSWRADHPPRHAAPPRLRRRGLPLSTDVDHGVPVQRIAVTGEPAAEIRQRPTPTGRWQQGRLGLHRRPKPEDLTP